MGFCGFSFFCVCVFLWGFLFVCIPRRNLGINLQKFLIFTCWSYDYAYRSRKQLGTANHIFSDHLPSLVCDTTEFHHEIIISLRLEKTSKSNTWGLVMLHKKSKCIHIYFFLKCNSSALFLSFSFPHSCSGGSYFVPLSGPDCSIIYKVPQSRIQITPCHTGKGK